MSEKMSMYVLTDTHYISRKMWEEGPAINGRERGDQIAIKATPEILRSFFAEILKDNETENVLITGDLINSGDKQSHLDFIDELKVLTDAGKKVFVTTATHDYAGENEDGDENIFHAVRYNENGTEPAERVGKKDLLPLYYDFGPAQSTSVHNTGSYSLPIAPGFRLIAINDNGNGRSHCGLFEEGFDWLRSEIRKAHEAGEYVFLAVHHPVLPPWQVYQSVADFEMFGGYEELRRMMCEENVKVIFTGHTHVHGIRKYTDEKGRFFYDVATSSLAGANCAMRKVVFDKEKSLCSIETVRTNKILGVDTNGLSAHDYIYGLNFSGLLENALPLAKTDWELFLEKAGSVIDANKLREHEKLARFAFDKFDTMKMSFIGKLAGKYGELNKREKQYLKTVSLRDVTFTILAHVFTGNAPYTPDTAEYKALTGVTRRADGILRLIKKDISEKLPGIASLTETAIPFLYNCRTGDDDSITFEI